MYEYIKGILTKITAKYIVVETAGIGYLLHVANPYAYSGKVNQEVQVYLHQVVREDAHLLYGFATEEEKQLFLNLISVSGIGPVSALAIIAADDNAGLVQAIESKNITYLTKFPKIGKKTAQQMVLDLEGKINLDLEEAPAQSKAKRRKKTKPWKKPWKLCWPWATRQRNLRKSRNFLRERRILLRTTSSLPLRCW